MIEYHDDIAEIDGISFRKDKKSGYYLSSKAIQGKRKRLHIYIWEKYNEEKEAREHDTDIAERMDEARRELYQILKRICDTSQRS